LQLGCTVRELLKRVDSKELSEWMAFDSIEPIGDIRTDLAAGIVASTVANCHRGKSQQAFMPMDFMPLHQKETTAENAAEEVGSKLRAFSIMNKSIKSNKENEE
jgi:hypothetical protein